MKFTVKMNDREPVRVETGDYAQLRNAMFELQRYHEATELIARDEFDVPVAHMTFEWVE